MAATKARVPCPAKILALRIQKKIKVVRLDRQKVRKNRQIFKAKKVGLFWLYFQVFSIRLVYFLKNL